jgi:catechol 2,3-dioxygenase-like lactoylglutathione lyase family enzyme
MDPAIPELDVALPGVDQVAVVVEDLQDGVDRWRAILGVEEWAIHRFEPPALAETTYRGDDVEYGMWLALGEAGDTQIELIEPTMGETIYHDHLAEHGEGLHHVAYFGWEPAEAEAVVAEFVDAGMPVLQRGHIGGVEFVYLDTAEQLNGVIFETSIRRGELDLEPAAVYPDDPFPT